jgi:hypothetical protein
MAQTESLRRKRSSESSLRAPERPLGVAPRFLERSLFSWSLATAFFVGLASLTVGGLDATRQLVEAIEPAPSPPTLPIAAHVSSVNASQVLFGGGRMFIEEVDRRFGFVTANIDVVPRSNSASDLADFRKTYFVIKDAPTTFVRFTEQMRIDCVEHAARFLVQFTTDDKNQVGAYLIATTSNRWYKLTEKTVTSNAAFESVCGKKWNA